MTLMLFKVVYEAVPAPGSFNAYPRNTSIRCYLEASGSVDYQDNMILDLPMAFSMLGTLRGFSSGTISHL